MTLELLTALFLSAALSGIVPIVNAELIVLTTAAALPSAAFLVVAAAAAVGQMVAKTALFGLARWAPQALPAKARARVDAAAARLSRHEGKVGTLVFASASAGVPPFYGVSIAAGTLGTRLETFVGMGTVGRFVRFAVLAWAGSRFGPAALDVLIAAGVPAGFVGGGS